MTKYYSPTQQVGHKVEKLVCRYLQQQGLSLITQNFFTLFGELDLIMQEGTTLVFVEVRYRKTTHIVSGLESVNSQKQKKLIHSAQYYLQKNPQWQSARFDVVAVSPGKTSHDIDWIKDAFQVQ
jgi:putative endonuclease